MELVYTFDPAKFHLGTLCKHGHKWPGTEQSLRRTCVDKNGKDCSKCAGCTGSKTKDWMLSFVDRVALGLKDDDRLGPVCKGGHLWQGHQLTLRTKGKCEECKRVRKRVGNMSEHQLTLRRQRNNRSYAKNAEKRREEAKLKNKAIAERIKADPVYAAQVHKQRREYKRQLRRRQGAKPLAPLELRQMQNAICNAGKQPSVAKLVMDEQRRYWREHPDVYAQFDRERKRLYHQWRQMTDPEYRLYHRQKSKRRKAQMRNSTAHQLSGKHVRRRFAEFKHRCAYCGADGDLHIEHVDPISKGGAHVLSNIVPACKACNYSKHTYEVERWYRAQPFFTEQRWQAICAVTDAGLLPVPIQLGLALAC
jgi:5-methylcytosine-specific restriction endonuclease McrA